MSEKYLYLPKVLFQTRPKFRADLEGSGDTNIRGECLFYPFNGGSIIITAINGLPDGFFRLKISGSAFEETELPSLLSTHGFCYSLVHDGRFIPDSINSCRILITGADSDLFASGSVK